MRALDDSCQMVNADFMNRFKVATFLFLISLASSYGVSIKSAYTRYYEEGEIRPISQYFGANLIGQGFRSVIASNPDIPRGQYFIVKLSEAKSGSPVQARMSYFVSTSKDPIEYSWDLSDKRLRKWLYLGLTGPDWPSPDIEPLAWKIELLDTSGKVLTEWKSFLWEM